MNWMGRSVATVALILTAACQTTGEGRVADSIEVRSFSGLFGGSSYVMRPDGSVTVSQWAEGAAEPEVQVLTSAASFATVAAVARDAIGTVGPVSTEACLDYGTDTVELRQDGRVESVVSACPNDAVSRAQTLVRAAMLDGAN